MEEKSSGKIVTKFAFKFCKWTIVYFIIGTISIFMMFSGKANGIDENDVSGMVSFLKSFIYGLVFVDVVTALLATKLSIGGVAKKIKITSENASGAIKGIAVVLVVIALLTIFIHKAMVSYVESSVMEEYEDYDTISELVEAAEKEADVLNLSDEDEVEEAIDGLKSVNSAATVYSFSGVVFLAMIPLANVLLKKKIEN